MASAKTSTIKGRDVRPGDVIKIDGRWCRIRRFNDVTGSSTTSWRYATVAAPGTDPRLADSGRVGRSVTGRWRLVHGDDDYLTRTQPAPRWEWVDRNIDAADGITTPCAVCAVTARVKGFPQLWVARGLDWPVTQVAGRRVHKACASDAEYLVRHAADIAITDGVARWTTSGQVLPDDCAALAARLDLAPGMDLAATAAARDAETAAFLNEYRASVHRPDAEQLAEMRAAFGPDQVVVNVISGQETRT
jgi:hypothetical protein